MDVFTLDWWTEVPSWVLGVLLLAAAFAVGLAGYRLLQHFDRKRARSGFASEGQEGYVVSAVLGLLALMLGFTLAMAVDRFDTRRKLVLEEANAIHTTYLRVQLLGEPHRTRLSKLLIDYTDNRIVLATAQRADTAPLLAANDRMLTDIWSAAAAAFDTISNLDFSSSFIEGVNNLIEVDAARKASRLAHVPMEILVVLSVYILVSAGMLGYVLTGSRGHLAGAFVITLMTFALALILDLEKPTMGGIRESQAPMELLQRSLKSQPPEIFDRWRSVQSQLSPQRSH